MKRLAAIALFLAAGLSWALPSTFETSVGPALLCQDHVDPGYFYTYLKGVAGAPIKREGGAWWFVLQPGSTLWGEPVNYVFISDGSSDYDFIGAALSNPPEMVAEALKKARILSGWKFEGGPGKQPVRVAPTGSRITYDGRASRIYCARWVGPHLPARP